MGYSYATFNWLKPFAATGCRVLDLGSQDVNILSADELREVNKFIGNGNPISVEQYPVTFTTADIWKRAGYNYRCIDVDERPDTIFVDLQGCQYPAELKYGFDLVVNAGTTEHLSNPAGGLAFAHYACRDGGVIAHDVPLFGCMNHALTCPTPKFWVILRWMNDYEVLSAGARKCEEPPGDLNFAMPQPCFINGLEAAVGLSWMISIAFRKNGNTAFVAPVDAIVQGSDGEMESRLILSSMLPLLAGNVWTDREAQSAVNHIKASIQRPIFPPTKIIIRRLRRAIDDQLAGQNGFAELAASITRRLLRSR